MLCWSPGWRTFQPTKVGDFASEEVSLTPTTSIGLPHSMCSPSRLITPVCRRTALV